ncbi:MAG TPA: hypothetical protein PK285_11985 [Bacteroidales bacterium]|nr:hypothetical protein [Bacteroidales bacterium]
MKARVLTYENEVSNNLTIKKLDLIETKNENLFLHEIGKDTAYVVLKIEKNDVSIFVETKLINKDFFFENINKFEKYRLNFLDSWKSCFPTLLIIEANRLVGNDTKPIIEARETSIAKIKKEELEKERIKNEIKLQRQRDDLLRAEKIKSDLKENKRVPFSDLIFAMDELKFKIHPRTKGAILKQTSYFTINLTNGAFNKKTTNQTAKSIFEVVRLFANS